MIPITAWWGAAKGFVIVGCIVALAAAVGFQTVRVATTLTALATEQKERAREASERTTLALRDSVRWSEKMASHAATEQGITNELAEETAKRVALERGYGQLGGLLRIATAAVAAAGAVAATEVGAVAGQCGSDRPSTILGYFGEAGQLLARSADVSEEARSVIARRDSEVKALKGEVKALRALSDAL
jgi:hypothetical protein